jgi:hypothetical protein
VPSLRLAGIEFAASRLSLTTRQLLERKEQANGEKDDTREAAKQGRGKRCGKGTSYREGHPDTDPIHGWPYRIRARRGETGQEALTRPGCGLEGRIAKTGTAAETAAVFLVGTPCMTTSVRLRVSSCCRSAIPVGSRWPVSRYQAMPPVSLRLWSHSSRSGSRGGRHGALLRQHDRQCAAPQDREAMFGACGPRNGRRVVGAHWHA